MPIDEIKVALAKLDAYIKRVSEMLAVANAGRDIPRHLLLDENELRNLDVFLNALAARKLRNPQPSEDVWMAPVRFAYQTGYGKNGPNGWLEAFYRGLKQSQSFFKAFDSRNTNGGNVTNYNITIKDVVGPVNVLSRLENVVQTINGADGLSTANKETLMTLVEELKNSLSAAPANLSSDAELISEQAETLVEEISRLEPRSSAIKIKASGLIAAAKVIEAVVPTAIVVAKKIAEFVTNPLA